MTPESLAAAFVARGFDLRYPRPTDEALRQAAPMMYEALVQMHALISPLGATHWDFLNALDVVVTTLDELGATTPPSGVPTP